jgi:ABC-type sulfate transport system permease component
MTLLAVLPTAVVGLVLALADEAPKPEDVTAGWTAFAIFLLLAAAVALLGFSLVKQLRKAQAAKDAGVYGDDPEKPSH